jgi:plastocyanin
MLVRPNDFAGIPPAMTEFKKGDEVEWKSHGSTTHGEVVEKITKDTKAAKRTVKASPEEPQYRVRSAKSGNDAVHKPEALKKHK